MNVILQIKKKEFDMILSGEKKREWRAPSKYNKNKLFKKRDEDGILIGNDGIKSITFVNGYSTDAKSVTVECLRIRMQKFSKNIEIPEDNFKALEGQCAIEIVLGKKIT